MIYQVTEEQRQQLRECLQERCGLRCNAEYNPCWEQELDTMLQSLAPVDAGHKPNCTECTKWTKEQTDNREWIEGVAEGKRIVERLAAKELQCRNS